MKQLFKQHSIDDDDYDDDDELLKKREQSSVIKYDDKCMGGAVMVSKLQNILYMARYIGIQTITLFGRMLIPT